MTAAKRQRARRGSGEQLREEIVAAAKKLLAEAGNADKVSIRAVADAVGVTPPSIYLHFADKDELLNAVVFDVFSELDAAMLQGADGLDEPLARLRAFGMSYIRFAVGHPEHYRLATMDPCASPPAVDEVLATSAFAHFQATVRECMDAGIFTPGDPLPITLDLWAAAHGIASLIIAKPYLPWGELDVVADRILCAAAMGHVVAGFIGPQPEPADIMAWLATQRRTKPAAKPAVRTVRQRPRSRG
ncbi:MAG TPA: TetR/AcrR family transcriptional regulator [Jatrophihabitantaceae bacterium]|jgi:AcrR family transcriptional regulator|nr:TetR/AcrR family transcriptional regulator [Jatrophihabitantaceae bacterium]